MAEFKELLALQRLVGITIECVATPHDPQSKGEKLLRATANIWHVNIQSNIM